MRIKKDNWNEKTINVSLSLNELLNLILWNWFIVKNTWDWNLLVESYYDGEKENEAIYNKNELWELTTFLNDIILESQDNYWCDNLYVIKWAGRKMTCKENLAKVWRLLYEIQSWYTETKEEIKDNIDDMIKELEEYKKEL